MLKFLKMRRRKIRTRPRVPGFYEEWIVKNLKFGRKQKKAITTDTADSTKLIFHEKRLWKYDDTRSTKDNFKKSH